MVTTRDNETAGAIPAQLAAVAHHLTPDDVLLTRREAAAYLRISMPTLERWKRGGILRGRKLGARILYSLAELREAADGSG